jgi:hypothetical protein
VTTWPATGPELERRYRRLLLAYPRAYRRRHGTEIVTTLLEMAEAGQNRPGRSEAWHLLAGGARQRLRLPTGRPLTVVAAVLVALTVGAFGAAAGSWLGARTFAAMPADAELAALARQATAGGEPIVQRVTSPWWPQVSWADTEVSGYWDADGARRRLAADGWSVSATETTPYAQAVWDQTTGTRIDQPIRDDAFTAERDGVLLQLRGHTRDGNGLVSVNEWPQPTRVFLPLILAGLAAGLLAGWLLVAALAGRLRHAQPARRHTATGLSVLALLTLTPPVAALYGNAIRAFRYAGDSGAVFTVHSAFTPGPYYPLGPQWQVPALSIAGVVVALAVAALTLRRASGRPEGVPAAT